MNPSSGVPQGSILGPLLFLIFVNDLVDRLASKSLQLADDLKISRKIETVEDCLALQNDIDMLVNWCTENRIKLNVKKCSVLTTTLKPNALLFKYDVGGDELTRVTSKKDLGVIFDNKLNFNEHIDAITRKAYRMLGFIFRSCKRFRNPQSLITLYNAYVRSQVEYCSVVWSPIYQNSIDKIERVQRKFTRMLYRKFNWQRVEYPDRLIRLKFPLLESRRFIADEIFLYNVIHHRFATNLETHLSIGNPIRTTRQVPPTFYPPIFPTNIESNAPIIRMQHQHDLLFKSIDIFNMQFKAFRRQVKSAYVM
jgi:ribonuclease P/MRP protein subunit RPP40